MAWAWGLCCHLLIKNYSSNSLLIFSYPAKITISFMQTDLYKLHDSHLWISVYSCQTYIGFSIQVHALLSRFSQNNGNLNKRKRYFMVDHSERLPSYTVPWKVAEQKDNAYNCLIGTKSNQSCWYTVILFRNILYRKMYYTKNSSPQMCYIVLIETFDIFLQV